MYTADPGGISIADPVLSTSVLVLGIFFIIVGILIAAVVYRESREWKRRIMPIFERHSTETPPESPEESSWLAREKASLGKEIFGRVFTHMDVAGLLGGGATIIMGMIIVLIGLSLNS